MAISKKEMEEASLADIERTKKRKEVPATSGEHPIERAAEQFQSAVHLDVGSILPSPYQSRASVDEEHIESLMATIGESGLINPILVRPIKVSDSDTFGGGKEGEERKVSESDTQKYELIAGFHRLEAHKRLGRSTIQAIVKRMSDVDAVRTLTLENTSRKNLSDWELYKHMVTLEKQKATKSVADLARILGCNRQKIYELECYAKLPDGTAELLDEKPTLIGASLARNLKDYCESNSDLVSTAIDRLASGKLNQSGVITWIKKHIEKPTLPFKKEVKLEGFRAIYTDNEAKITGDLDFEKLHALIEANLDSLKKI